MNDCCGCPNWPGAGRALLAPPMKELDCEYMVDEIAALAKAQEKKTKESVVVQEHSFVMIKWGSSPRSESYVDLQIILGKVSSVVSWQIQGTRQAQHSHAITSCEVEVSLFPTHGMHSKHL